MEPPALDRSALLAQTSLRSIIGKSDLDDLLSNRERLNQGLELITIRHYNQKTTDKVVNKRKILLEQKSRLTVQLVVEGEKSGKK